MLSDMSEESAKRTVSWGEALVVETFHTHGGLQAAVDAITAEMGPLVGSRPTFAKLLRVHSPEELSDRNRWRAWLLLAALHREPEDWGLKDDSAPASVDAEALKARLRARVRREGLEPPTRWFTHKSGPDEVAEVVPIRRLQPLKVLPLKVVPLRLVPALTVTPSSTALRAA